MSETVLHRRSDISLAMLVIEWLQEEVLEVQSFEFVRIHANLRINQLEFCARSLNQFGNSLWADAGPIDSARCREGAVRLDCDFEVDAVHRIDERLIQLKQRFSAGEDDVRSAPLVSSSLPSLLNMLRKPLSGNESSAADTVCADKVGVAKFADRSRAVLLATCPQVAAGEAAKDSRTAGLPTFTLQGVERLLDEVRHSYASAFRYGAGSLRPFSAKPRSRNWQASQWPHAAPSSLGS